MGSLCVAVSIEFECLVAVIPSCVHGRLRATELIGFTDHSHFLSRIQIPGYGSVFGLSFVVRWSLIKFGEILISLSFHWVSPKSANISSH